MDKKITKPCYDKTRQLPVNSYLPPKNGWQYLNLEPFVEDDLKDYKAAGFNRLLINEEVYAKNTPELKNLYALAEKHGLPVEFRSYDGFYIEGVHPYRGTPLKNFDVLDYSINDYDIIESVLLWDEPDGKMMDEIRDKFVDDWNEKYADKKILNINLYASYAGKALNVDESEYVDGSAYKGYLAKMANIFNMFKGKKMFGMDHYPLGYDREKDKDYLGYGCIADYAAVAEAVKTVNDCIPYYCIQAYGDRHGGLKLPNCEGDISLQIYLALGFGAKALCIYHYQSYTPNEISMIHDGIKLPAYYAVKSALTRMHKWAGVMLDFKYNAFKSYVGSNTEGSVKDFDHAAEFASDSLVEIKEVKATENTLVMHHTDNDGRNGYMVMNYTVPTEEKTDLVEITFDNDCNKALVYDAGEEVVMDIVDGKLSLKIPAGQGAFVIPY